MGEAELALLVLLLGLRRWLEPVLYQVFEYLSSVVLVSCFPVAASWAKDRKHLPQLPESHLSRRLLAPAAQLEGEEPVCRGQRGKSLPLGPQVGCILR
jgi:hypothetical protein